MASLLSGALAPVPAVDAAARPGRPTRGVAAWLLACCLLVFAMVVIGGATRLTHSGLSITEWQPIVGTVPPLSHADWEAAFARYQATPEFRLVNHDMTLAAFKGIFWWEYFHRLLGRVIGVAFLLPLAWFALRRRIPRGYGARLAGIFVLGGLQGALGWYMVQSGLVDEPRVAPIRLTAHLTLAFLIFAAMLWTLLSLWFPRVAARRAAADAARPTPPAAPGVPHRATRRLSYTHVALVLAMIVTGGMVAGLRAGFAYNTFPLMHGHVVPPEILMLQPVWKNFLWNMATVQFDHRAFAWIVAFVTPWLWWRVARDPGTSTRARTGARALLAMVAVQIALGIATLVNVVPLALAVCHQAGALLVFALSLNVAHAMGDATAPNPAIG
jgi:cytochrome c oxidase assembly protein subunit 15